MKLLLILLLSVCFLKGISLSLYLKIIPEAKEIDRFYERERDRIYNNHSIEAGITSIESDGFDAISKDSVRHLLGENRNKDTLAVFKRNWFQGYARYLKSLDTTKAKITDIDLSEYPPLLRNTVAEENAYQEINFHYEHLPRSDKSVAHWSLKGMITDIDIVQDSLEIALIPFNFESNLEYLHCQCGTISLRTKTNPFHYTGPLVNCQCSYQNLATKENLTIDVQRLQ